MKKEAKKREWFSFNNALVFIIILMVIAVLRAIVSTETGTVSAKIDLEQEAIDVLRTLTNKNMPTNVLESNELVAERVESLYRMDYNDIKSLAGIKSDFCIFFEDVTGKIVTINGVKSGIGSSKIHINGKPCE